MKILTIATPRSGGFYFTKSLADIYGLTHDHEPPYIDEFSKTMKRYNDVSIKLHVEQLQKHYELELGLSVDDSVDRIYDDISKYNFDNIFIVDRKNKEEHIEAVINVLYHKKNMFAPWNPTDEEYLKIRNSEKWNLMEFYVNAASNWLDKLSNKFGIPKIYYEDLYYDTNNVDLQGLEFKPDTTKKLRTDNPPPLI